MEERNFAKELFEFKSAVITEIMDTIEMALKNTNKAKLVLECPVEVLAVDTVSNFPANYNVTEVDADNIYNDEGREMELNEITAESLVDLHGAIKWEYRNWI